MADFSIEDHGTASAAAELAFVSIYVLTVLYAPRNAVALRILSLASLAGVSWVLGVSLMRLTAIPQWRATMTTFCGIQLLNASEILCVFRVDSMSISQTASKKDNNARQGSAGTTAAIAAKTIGLLWNLRRIGTQWEIKKVAPTRRESRTRFLTRRVSLTLLAYTVLEFLLLQPPPESRLIGSGKETLFIRKTRLSVEDIAFRVGATLGMGITVVLYNLIMVNAANISMVAVGVSRPEECPTLNGSISEAYTVRKFWG